MTHPLGLAEIQALYEKATKGPWELHLREDDPDSYTMTGPQRELLRKIDAKLIVALVNAWPQLREMARDCERYRWLRDNATEHCDNQQPYVSVHVRNSWGKWEEKLYEGDELDAAIDAASKEQSRG